MSDSVLLGALPSGSAAPAHTSDAAAPDLAALIGSRICHDLISPIGAIGNGVELLAMAGSGLGAELSLIEQSVANASARIRFFRIAFGYASAGQRIGGPEVLSVVEGITRGTRLQVAWQAGQDEARAEVKAAFLALMCLEQALPWGGAVSVTRQDGRWVIRADAPRMRIDAPLWDILDGAAPVTPPQPSQVQFLLLPKELGQIGRRIEQLRAPTSVMLSF